MQDNQHQNPKGIDPRWMERYQQLKIYYHQHGNCKVPYRYKENVPLANWVIKQRQDYKKNKLSQEKIELLNDINFDWDRHDTRWKEMYDQLKDFYHQHHHSNVPFRYPENYKLESWVRVQRHDYKRGLLSQERIDLLNELNFDWRE